MIDVRMAENDSINLFRIEREFAIALDRLLAFALEQAAFEKKTVAVDLEEIHRAGGRASRAQETDLHGAKNGNRRDKVERFISLGVPTPPSPPVQGATVLHCLAR